MTSGLQQSAYPPGIPVGLISVIGYSEGAERRGVTLRPAVDLARLTFVKVLIWQGTAK